MVQIRPEQCNKLTSDLGSGVGFLLSLSANNKWLFTLEPRYVKRSDGPYISNPYLKQKRTKLPKVPDYKQTMTLNQDALIVVHINVEPYSIPRSLFQTRISEN